MPLVPSYIKKLTSYKPGKPIQEAQRELGLNRIIKLSSNENPIGPSPKALKAINNIAYDLHRYPDASGYYLRKKLADKHKIDINNVIIGAGSEGIMSTIIRTFLLNDDELISAKNSFIGFRVLANASGKKTHWVPMLNFRYDLNSMAKQISDYTKIIYIANPDNPTGTYITKKEFDDFYSYVPPRVLIILDEAYFEYSENNKDYPDSMSYKYDNVITLRSFSKAYGLGGLRVGYGFAHCTLIENLMKVKVPFEPSSLAQEAGIAAIEDHDFLSKTLHMNNTEKRFLQRSFEELDIQYIPSATNFVTTIWNTVEKAIGISRKLLDRGIIVRNLSNFGLPDCIRISIGLPEENRIFINSLKSIL